MTCCDRIRPCAEAIRLWEIVAETHRNWTHTHPRYWHAKARRQRVYDLALVDYEAHFVETPVEQGAMPL